LIGRSVVIDIQLFSSTMAEETGRQIDTLTSSSVSAALPNAVTENEYYGIKETILLVVIKDRQMYRRTDGQTDRHADPQIHRQTDRHTNR
jgi:hypothetical protein